MGRIARAIELRLLQESISRHIMTHTFNHLVHRLRDRVLVRVWAHRAEDRVAHDHRGLGWVEDDDGLALLGTTDVLHALGRGLGELIDILSGARTSGQRGHRRHDFGVAHVGCPRHRSHHRDGRLTTTGDHIDVGCVGMSIAIDCRDARWADRSRRQVDCQDAGLLVARCVCLVHIGARGFEEKVGQLVLLEEPIDTFVTGLQALLGCTREAWALGVDPDHPSRLDHIGAKELVHQIGADISRPNDGCCEL